jgi:hypothetical protein
LIGCCRAGAWLGCAAAVDVLVVALACLPARLPVQRSVIACFEIGLCTFAGCRFVHVDASQHVACSLLCCLSVCDVSWCTQCVPMCHLIVQTLICGNGRPTCTQQGVAHVCRRWNPSTRQHFFRHGMFVAGHASAMRAHISHVCICFLRCAVRFDGWWYG